MKIRHATLNDIPTLVDMARRMYEESVFRIYDFSGEKLANIMSEYITGKRLGYFAVAEDAKGNIKGAMWSSLNAHIFGNDKIVNTIAWFVDTDKRNGYTAIKLMKATEKWAIENKAKQLSIGISTGINVERTGKLLNRLGMETTGGTYRKVL